MTNRVVITGAGVVSALGNDWQTVRRMMQNGRSAVRYMPEWEQYPELGCRIAAPVDYFELPTGFSMKKTRSMGRVAQMAVTATRDALDAAGLLDDPILKDGTAGIAYGSATGSSEAALEFFELLENKSMSRINGTTYIRMMSHTAAVNLSVCFGTTGRMYTTSTACTAGSQGIGYGYDAIRSGQQQIMITGGAEELCPTQAAVFDTVYAASSRNDQPDKTPRPYDAGRDGLVLGEGATTLILENLDHALGRGANILGEVIGYATNTDGQHVVRPNQQTMAKVMSMALENADVDLESIGYVCGHGTGTEHGDIAETRATEEVMGKMRPISSLKSYTGHTLGACGAFEAWATISMLNDGEFAPTINLSAPDPRCGELDFIRDGFRPIIAHRAMSNNFAFGGVNTSLVLATFPAG